MLQGIKDYLKGKTDELLDKLVTKETLPKETSKEPPIQEPSVTEPPKPVLTRYPSWLGEPRVRASLPENFWTEIVYYPYPVSSTEYDSNPALRAYIKKYAHSRKKELALQRRALKAKK